MSESFGIIGVMMGGPSAEREISLKSGTAVAQALMTRGHNAVPIILEPAETTASQIAARLQAARCEVAFIAMHGTFGEDGTLQELLEQLEMPYTGSGPDASRLAFDKWLSRQTLAAHDLATPFTLHFTRQEASIFQQQLPQLHRTSWDAPVVAKPVRQGSSVGISLAASPAELATAIDVALRFDDELLLETYVRGREMTVAIFDEQALPPIEIRPKTTFFDFEAKYQAQSTEYLVPAPVSEELTLRVQQAALTAHRALGCRHFSRVDMIVTDDHRPVVLEVNTIPGLTARSLLPMAAQACGCSFPALCEHMVALALEAHPAMSLAVRNP